MTDKQLIESTLKGNQASIKFIVDKYQPLVLNTCNRFFHNKQNAEDVTQEVYIEVLLSIHKFRKDAKLPTWLYKGISNNLIIYQTGTPLIFTA